MINLTSSSDLLHFPVMLDEVTRICSPDKGGVYIQSIYRGSPAAKAGLMPGDILVSINGEKIKSADAIVRMVANLKPKKSYPVEVFRRGDFLTFSVIIGERKR